MTSDSCTYSFVYATHAVYGEILYGPIYPVVETTLKCHFRSFANRNLYRTTTNPPSAVSSYFFITTVISDMRSARLLWTFVSLILGTLLNFSWGKIPQICIRTVKWRPNTAKHSALHQKKIKNNTFRTICYHALTILLTLLRWPLPLASPKSKWNNCRHIPKSFSFYTQNCQRPGSDRLH